MCEGCRGRCSSRRHHETCIPPIKFSNQQRNVGFKSRFNAQISSLFIYFFPRLTGNPFRSIISCINQLILVTNQHYTISIYVYLKWLDWVCYKIIRLNVRTQYECLLTDMMSVQHDPRTSEKLITIELFISH